MKKHLPILTVRLPQSIIDRLDSQAKAENLERSALVRRVLCYYLDIAEPVILQGFAEMPKRKLRVISRRGVESRKK